MSDNLKRKRRGARASQEPSVLKGLAAGLAGGLVAAAAMNRFQALLSRLTTGQERTHGAQSLQQGSPEHGLARELQAKGAEREDDDAPERLANIISTRLFDKQLTESEKETAGTALHYGMGLTAGAIYGVTAEAVPAVKAGAGLPFGAAVWLIADEGIVPAAGLSKSAAEYPWQIHAYALASHLVFGLAAEVVRRAVRRAL